VLRWIGGNINHGLRQKEAVQKNIKADIEALIQKYGVKNIRDFARKLLVQAAMEERIRGKINK
jgi:hypothetical protein